ncbi:hypothetical protein FQN54_009042 [Arachnomyces sp. PD_36]|nr:hypothetical protein FQN54_009042 [Arachnomyces sp. PD_36]
MRLRGTIKAPTRYGDDDFDPQNTGRRPSGPPCTRPDTKIPFIDFNPNLPPAAFPTLDQPRPSCEPEPKGKGVDRGEGDGQHQENERDGDDAHPTLDQSRSSVEPDPKGKGVDRGNGYGQHRELDGDDAHPTQEKPIPSVEPGPKHKAADRAGGYGQHHNKELGGNNTQMGERDDNVSRQTSTFRHVSDNAALGGRRRGEEDALMHNFRVGNENNPFFVPRRVPRGGEAVPPSVAPAKLLKRPRNGETGPDSIRSGKNILNGNLQEPTWDEISARLQVEIIHNLLETHTWEEAVDALNISLMEEISVLEHYHDRNGQLATESRVIRDMHMEQLKAILRVDNLDPQKRRAPDQLVLRRSTRRYMGDLMKRVSPDYLMCQPWELSSAREYLQHVGLDPDLAGVWSNDLVTIEKDERGVGDVVQGENGGPPQSENQGAQAGKFGKNGTETDKAPRSSVLPKMGVFTITGPKNAATQPGPSQQPPRTEPAPQLQLNAAQQIFHHKYLKPPAQGRPQSRPRPRAHLQGPDKQRNIVQLNVGRHRGAEIQSNPPPAEHVAPGGNRNVPTPAQSEAQLEPSVINSVENPLEVDRRPRAASEPKMRVASPLVARPNPRGISVDGVSGPELPTDTPEKGAERPLRRNLGGSWSYRSFSSEADSSPCPPTRFRDAMEHMPDQGTQPSGSPDENTRVSEEGTSYSLPIRTSPLARTVSSQNEPSQHLTNDSNGGLSGPSTPKKKRKVRVSLDGSPILVGSKEDRITLQISDPPGFDRNHELGMTSSPPKMSAAKPRSKECEYPSPPTVRKNPSSIFASSTLTRTPEMDAKRGSLMQRLTQSRAETFLDSIEMDQAEASTVAGGSSGSDQNPGANTASYSSNIDPRLFGPPEPTAGHGMNEATGRDFPEVAESSQMHEGTRPIYMDRQVTETREPQSEHAEESLNAEESDPTPDSQGDAMEIDSEGNAQLADSMLSEFVASRPRDTIREEEGTPGADSMVSETWDTTLDEGNTTLPGSATNDAEGSTGAAKPKPRKARKPRARIGRRPKRGRIQAASKSVTKQTTSKATAKTPTAATAKKKEKAKEAAPRTQPRRTAKNGPEPQRELRSKATNPR